MTNGNRKPPTLDDPHRKATKRPVTVELDIYIARRKRSHSVIDADGETVFHAPNMADILTWLDGQDIRTATFVDGDDRFSVVFSVVPF